MRSSGLYGLISLLGAVGLVAAFVASFFILQWWLPIIMVVVLGFLAGLPAFYIGRDVERAMNIHPLLNLISAALGGTVVTVAVGLLHLPSIMFML